MQNSTNTNLDSDPSTKMRAAGVSGGGGADLCLVITDRHEQIE